VRLSLQVDESKLLAVANLEAGLIILATIIASIKDLFRVFSPSINLSIPNFLRVFKTQVKFSYNKPNR
jgi:hypothetical protein